MTIKTKWAVVAAGVAGAAVLSLAVAHRVSAHGGFHGCRDRASLHAFMGRALERHLEQIGADDAQRQKIQAVAERLAQEGRALHGEHQALRAELVALLEQDHPDAAKLKAFLRQRAEAYARFADHAADAALELHGILTPEQRQKLLAHIRDHGGRPRR